MVIILNGPCGVGKSTVAQKLAARLNKCVHIRVDDIRNFIVDAEINEEQNDIADINTLCITKNFVESGYNNIIIDNVFESSGHLSGFIKKIKLIDNDVHSFRLYASIEENIKRNLERRVENIMDESRVHELYDVFSDSGNEIGEMINTTNMSAEETAEIILKNINDN